eukprot:Rmarinus@m.21023
MDESAGRVLSEDTVVWEEKQRQDKISRLPEHTAPLFSSFSSSGKYDPVPLPRTSPAKPNSNPTTPTMKKKRSSTIESAGSVSSIRSSPSSQKLLSPSQRGDAYLSVSEKAGRHKFRETPYIANDPPQSPRAAAGLSPD